MAGVRIVTIADSIARGVVMTNPPNADRTDRRRGGWEGDPE
jgi:hypothetical protein